MKKLSKLWWRFKFYYEKQYKSIERAGLGLGLGFFMFLLFYFKIAPTDPWCKMLRDSTWMVKVWGANVRWTPSHRGYLTRCEQVLDLRRAWGAVYMRWNTSTRWDVSPEWGTFHPAFTWEKYSTWVGYFSPQLACMSISKQRCYFHCLHIFCFYFKFELLNKYPHC